MTAPSPSLPDRSDDPIADLVLAFAHAAFQGHDLTAYVLDGHLQADGDDALRLAHHIERRGWRPVTVLSTTVHGDRATAHVRLEPVRPVEVVLHLVRTPGADGADGAWKLAGKATSEAHTAGFLAGTLPPVLRWTDLPEAPNVLQAVQAWWSDEPPPPTATEVVAQVRHLWPATPVAAWQGLTEGTGVVQLQHEGLDHWMTTAQRDGFTVPTAVASFRRWSDLLPS